MSQICRTCYYHIRDLRCMPRYLPLLLKNQLQRVLVASRLDCHNSLFYNIAIKDITKL